MKFALVDDDLEQVQLLHPMIRTALAAHGIREDCSRCFSSCAAFLTDWRPGEYDLIMLDIYMTDMNGVDLARRIRQTDPQVALVFCTTSNEFAAESYEVHAQYYLQKPVTPEKLEAMLRRIDLSRLEETRSIQLPDGYRLLLRKLIYTNYINHAVTFYLQGAQPHTTYITQAEVERLLNDPCFYAANKGSIVNFHMVRKVTGDSFVMKDGSTVSIARRRYKEAKDAYARFHFQKLSEEAER